MQGKRIPRGQTKIESRAADHRLHDTPRSRDIQNLISKFIWRSPPLAEFLWAPLDDLSSLTLSTFQHGQKSRQEIRHLLFNAQHPIPGYRISEQGKGRTAMGQHVASGCGE